jgi:ribosomal protein S12 methylthiotransferase accessory factor
MLDLRHASLHIAYQDGTRRLRSPEQTLAFIQPKFPAMGITRLADVTQLDRLGIHTCCAIRPTSSVLQVSNGKGTSLAASMASAAMESIELFHAENPDFEKLQYATTTGLAGDVVEHKALNSFSQQHWHHDQQRIPWVTAVNAVTNELTWVPAGNIYFNLEPGVHKPSTNGLASGNHVVEAALHGLYEVIERDAGYLLAQHGKINLRERGRIVDLATIADPMIVSLLDSIDDKSKLVLCHIDSRVNVHTFWAILLNKPGGHPLTMLNPGWGTHRDMTTAASRAITEAAQSRLTNIHGAREDIVVRRGYSESNVEQSPAYRYFANLKPTTAWAELPTYSGASENLADDWQVMLQALDNAGLQVLVHDLTKDDLDIPVVKVIVPGLGFNQRMF